MAAAAANQASRAALISATLTAVLGAWATMDLAQLFTSWFRAGVGSRVYVLLSMAQESTASDSADFVEHAYRILNEPIQRPAILPATFAGIASDGRDLESLLAGAPILTLQRVRRGEPLAVASRAGQDFLRRVVTTQIADAGRAADQVAIATAEPLLPSVAQKRVRYGWVRMLNPPSCSRCVILAGRFYRWNEGFQRHEMCWPAGTVVSGPEVVAGSRRWYEGQLVTICTAGGEQVSVTANHPVLTLRGWVPAQFVQEGDQVLRGTRAEGAAALMVPDQDQVPARVEDVLAALRVHGFTAKVPTTAENFHGDGFHGEVDVAFTDGLLRNRVESTLLQELLEHHLAFGLEAPGALAGLRSRFQRLDALDRSPRRLMSIGYLEQALFDRHSTGSVQPGGGAVSRLHSCGFQSGSDLIAGPAVLLGEGELTLAVQVLPDGHVSIDNAPGARARWDPTGGPGTMQDSATDAGLAFDLVERLSGQVEPDRVVEVTRVDWSGHVYSLTTTEGWVSSNNIITSNCDCAHIPAIEDVADDLTTDPDLYFKSLSREEQDDVFGKANARAIRQGADLSQVVNATNRGGVRTADDGRVYTLEGTTRRGMAGRGRKGVLRPTPWQIYRDAKGDPDEARRLLRQFRYILR